MQLIGLKEEIRLGDIFVPCKVARRRGQIVYREYAFLRRRLAIARPPANGSYGHRALPCEGTNPHWIGKFWRIEELEDDRLRNLAKLPGGTIYYRDFEAALLVLVRLILGGLDVPKRVGHLALADVEYDKRRNWVTL